jgi:isoleucyl-tRNA synthetase
MCVRKVLVVSGRQVCLETLTLSLFCLRLRLSSTGVWKDHPSAVEAAWQDWWEASGFYGCDPAAIPVNAEKFVMVMPPPNVTGSLHLGHALTVAVEDTLSRWHRMHGRATLYLPGT